MNKQRALLAVMAVLLAVDVAVRFTDTAEAQPNPQYAAAPTVTGVHSLSDFMVRVWSDGVIEERQFLHGGDGNAIWYWIDPEWKQVQDETP